jgi:hypothetical protein
MYLLTPPYRSRYIPQHLIILFLCGFHEFRLVTYLLVRERTTISLLWSSRNPPVGSATHIIIHLPALDRLVSLPPHLIGRDVQPGDEARVVFLPVRGERPYRPLGFQVVDEDFGAAT